MKIKYLLLLLISLIINVTVALLVVNYEKTQIAYVRSQELVYDYAGTKEVMAKFNDEKLKWQANVDTLQLNFEKAVKAYKEEYQNLNEKQRLALENKLSNQEKQLIGYRKAISEKVKEKDQMMLEGVVNQINGFVKSYGEKKGYDIILGTTQSGNLLHAHKSLDITDEVIEAMNKNYLGE